MKKSILAVVTMASALTVACATHVGVGYRVYDPYYSDYHVWGPDEGVYYNRWAVENHRENRDFRRLYTASMISLGGALGHR